MRQLVSSRWFALADLVLVVLCGAVLYFRPPMGGWLIILAILPLLIRLATGHVSFKRYGLIIPLVIFVITAGVGVWAAYDRQAALEKFWILNGAVLIFVALVSQPKANLGVIAGLVGIMGVIIAIVFILTNDWNTQSTDFGVINRAGQWIMTKRPSIRLTSVPPNFVGGILAMLAPIPLALGIHNWKRGEFTKTIILLIMGVMILGGLFLTSSRGAWLALILAFGIWILWRVSLYISLKTRKSSASMFILLSFMILIVVILIIISRPVGVLAIVDSLPGLPSGESRFDLAKSAVKLIEDFPFTGGGLRSFAGLYSQYIMVIPFFLFSYSHNFYLDVILEQGWLGGFVLLFVFLWSVWLLARRVSSNRSDQGVTLLSEAVLIGIIVIFLHGLVDDALYGDMGTPLLLFMPGLAFMLIQVDQPSSIEMDKSTKSTSSGKIIMGLGKWILLGCALSIVVLIVNMRNSFLSTWFANLGSVEMSRIDLLNWPINKWNDNPDVFPLNKAEDLFNTALINNPDQRTARHRLGLVAMQGRDFIQAQDELERAYNIDREHRGIRKNLGYTYVWMGNLNEAVMMLDGVHEAESEMGVYASWWREKDRQDLSWQATEVVRLLSDKNSSNLEEGDD